MMLKNKFCILFFQLLWLTASGVSRDDLMMQDLTTKAFNQILHFHGASNHEIATAPPINDLDSIVSAFDATGLQYELISSALNTKVLELLDDKTLILTFVDHGKNLWEPALLKGKNSSSIEIYGAITDEWRMINDSRMLGEIIEKGINPCLLIKLDGRKLDFKNLHRIADIFYDEIPDGEFRVIYDEYSQHGSMKYPLRVNVENLSRSNLNVITIPISNLGKKILNIVSIKGSCSCLLGFEGEKIIKPGEVSYLELFFDTVSYASKDEFNVELLLSAASDEGNLNDLPMTISGDFSDETHAFLMPDRIVMDASKPETQTRFLNIYLKGNHRFGDINVSRIMGSSKDLFNFSKQMKEPMGQLNFPGYSLVSSYQIDLGVNSEKTLGKKHQILMKTDLSVRQNLRVTVEVE